VGRGDPLAWVCGLNGDGLYYAGKIGKYIVARGGRCIIVDPEPRAPAGRGAR